MTHCAIVVRPVLLDLLPDASFADSRFDVGKPTKRKNRCMSWTLTTAAAAHERGMDAAMQVLAGAPMCVVALDAGGRALACNDTFVEHMVGALSELPSALGDDQRNARLGA